MNKKRKIIKLFRQYVIPNFINRPPAVGKQAPGQAPTKEGYVETEAATASRGTPAIIFCSTRSVVTPSASASKLTINL